MIKVQEHSGLYKDPSSNTFINRNDDEIEAARERKKIRAMKEEKGKELEVKVDKLTEDMGRLTKMLEQLLEKEHGTS